MISGSLMMSFFFTGLSLSQDCGKAILGKGLDFDCPGTLGSGDLVGGEIVADEFEEFFDFFDGDFGVEREGDEVFSFLNGSGFVGFDAFAAEFGAELVGDGGEDGDGEGLVFLLEDGGCHDGLLGAIGVPVKDGGASGDE